MKPQLLVRLAVFATGVAGCGTANVSVARASNTEARSAPSVESTTSTTRGCTQADMDAPPISAMPAPTDVTSPMMIDNGNETLSAPDDQPRVTAAQAWAKVAGSGFAPRSSGDARLMLADLSAKTPATIQNYAWPPSSDNPDTQAEPIYTHTLVWVVIASDQAGVPAGGGAIAFVPGLGLSTSATTVPTPDCFLETAVTYVEADTGDIISAESF